MKIFSAKLHLRILPIIAAMFFLSASFKSASQDMWGKYCYFDANMVMICKATRKEMFDSWKSHASHPITAPFEPEEVSETGYPGLVAVLYHTPYFAPIYEDGGWGTEPPEYEVFTRHTQFRGPDLSTVIEQFEHEILISEDPNSTFQLTGSIDEDFSKSDVGYLSFTSDLNIVTTNRYGVTAYPVSKTQTVGCGIQEARPNSGWNIGRAPPGSESEEISWNQLCGHSGFQSLEGLLERKSCPANANPCYPTTGDKARFETDFVFAGRPFVRTYHSVQQIGTPGIPHGWSITYGEWAGPYIQVDGSGYIDTYNAGANGINYSKLTPNNILYSTPTGSTSRAADGTYRDFDQNQSLSRLYDPSRPGNDVLVSHDPFQRILTLTDSQNRVATFHYSSVDSDGLLSSIDLPDGTSLSYEYDSDGNLSIVHFPDGSTRAYLYGEPELDASGYKHMLTGILDESGQRYASFSYDSRGRVLASKLYSSIGDVESTQISYATNAANVFTDGVGSRAYSFGGIEFKNPTSIATIGGGTEYYENYSDARLTKKTDANGNVTTYAYSGSFVTERDEAVGTSFERRANYTPDSRGNITREIISNVVSGAAHGLLQIDRIFNSRDQAETETRTDLGSSEQRVVSNAYCESGDVASGSCPQVGLIKSVNGPRTDVSDVTTFTYYQTDDAACATAPTACPRHKGDLWKVTNALGQVTETLKYDGAGRALSVKDPNGVTIDFEYHPRGWLTARKVRGINNASENDDQITRIDYWPTGLVKKVTQPDGSYTSYSYDDAHRLTDIADNAGNTIHYTLDNAGNRKNEETKGSSGALARVLSRDYNQLGQLETQFDAQLHRTGFTYDDDGNPDTVTDARGHVTDNDYDPLNRLSKTIQDLGGVAPAQTSFGYDALDNLTTVTDPKGLVTTYTYNGLSDLKTLSSPDTGTTSYTYDSGGNRQTQTDQKGITATYGYDALNRLTSVSYPTTSLNVAYVYDTPGAVCQTGETFGKGRLAKITDSTGSTSYCYGRFGDLLRKVQVTNGKVFTVRYGYDRAGRMTSLTYPDGTVADYVRDGLGNITETGLTRPSQPRVVVVTGATYAPFGPSTGWAYPGGRALARPLDLDYRPAQVFDGGPGGGLSYTFGFDPAGNLDTLKDGLQSQTLAHYRYDGLNRLDQTQDGPTGTPIETYTYNTTGDRLSTIVNPNITTNYTYPATNHRLVGVGGVARVPDANGNTTSIGGTAKVFRFNDANRMDQTKASGTVLMNYAYNGKGEQVRRYLGTVNTYTVYDEAGHWLGDYDNTGAPLQQAVWMDDLPVGLAADKLYYVEPDHLGTPRAVIDPTRNVAVWRWDLDGEVFGNTVPNQDPDLDSTNFVFNLRYPGQRYDSASGLNYNHYRDYDTSVGRYIEADPTGLLTSWSTYSYTNSSPIRNTDPLGLFTVTAWEVETYLADPSWTFEFEFSHGCAAVAALELADLAKPKFEKAISTFHSLFGLTHKAIDPVPAGDTDILLPERRCHCLNYDPELATYFSDKLHGVEGEKYTREEATGFINALSQEFYRLRRKKCGPDQQCRADNTFYDWDSLLDQAQARGQKVYGGP